VREAPRDTGRQRSISSRGPGGLTPRSVPTVSLSRLTGENAFELLDEIGGANGRGEHATVLLVEDEGPLRSVLRELLEREGYDVVEAADGVAALDAVDRAAPAIIVLDLSLPRLDGYGVLKRLRARPATAHLPVIVLTAHGDEDSEVRVFESGADDFLTKPFRPRALSARLRALLKRTAHPTADY
jgi:CheY-like chemotaxis protein